MRRIIINADDFGLTTGVNSAVIELHANGFLTSATLMAHASATEDAIALALKTPTLGVGCHIILVDGNPTLPAHSIPTLIDSHTGLLHRKLTTFLRLLLLGRIHPDEIQAEATAQIARLTQTGLRLTHIDSHKHTHMFPAVLRPVLKAARAAGISSVRNPFEPLWSRRATPAAPVARRIQVNLLHSLHTRFRRTVQQEGFTTTNGSLGVLATGSLTAETVASLLTNMPDGTWELVTHPGYNDQDLAQVTTRLKESRDIERKALTAVTLEENLELVSFAQLGRILPS